MAECFVEGGNGKSKNIFSMDMNFVGFLRELSGNPSGVSSGATATFNFIPYKDNYNYFSTSFGIIQALTLCNEGYTSDNYPGFFLEIVGPLLPDSAITGEFKVGNTMMIFEISWKDSETIQIKLSNTSTTYQAIRFSQQSPFIAITL